MGGGWEAERGYCWQTEEGREKGIKILIPKEGEAGAKQKQQTLQMLGDFLLCSFGSNSFW
jgi:hypothetical protein